MERKAINGFIAGYDPGGNNSHGLAIGEYENGICKKLVTSTEPNAESVIQRLESTPDLLALGVDTLVCWATDNAGWRPADLWLRKQYPQVANSVMNSNYLSGSMSTNGMAVILSLVEKWPEMPVVETHPKVLYYALTGGKRHEYETNPQEMRDNLTGWLGYEFNPVQPNKDHELDAALSVYAVYKGLCGDWTHDLFDETEDDTGRLVCPATRADSHYWWPPITGETL